MADSHRTRGRPAAIWANPTLPYPLNTDGAARGHQIHRGHGKGEGRGLAAEVLGMIEPFVVPGVRTEALDAMCHEPIVKVQGTVPANLGYQGHPNTILTSVNQVVCHGIPSADKILNRGDIVNIDVAVIKDGRFGDTSRMFFVSEPIVLVRRMVETTCEALLAGIRQVRPGATLGDMGHAIQSVAHREHFSVAKREITRLADGWTVVTTTARSLLTLCSVGTHGGGHARRLRRVEPWPGGTGAYAPV